MNDKPKQLPNETEAFFRWLLIQIGEAKEEDFAPATETDTRIEDDMLSAYKAKHTTESADTGCGK